MSDKLLTEQECEEAAADRTWGDVYVRRALATIADLRAKLVEAERERDAGEGCRLCHCCNDAPGRHGEIMSEWVERAETAEAEARALREALVPIGSAYPNNPGTSDLDNEQPVTITLGDVRRAWAALRGKEADRG